MTIDELIQQQKVAGKADIWTPGSLRVRISEWSAKKYFAPFYMSNGFWYGVTNTAEHAAYDDIIDNWIFYEESEVEPRSGSVWVNIYKSGMHSSKNAADSYASKDRWACVEVKWTEGEGLCECFSRQK